jgi:hypothetical protein
VQLRPEAVFGMTDLDSFHSHPAEIPPEFDGGLFH